jgi:osmotically inducible protein OsmC
MALDSTARTHWEGDLMTGEGRVTGDSGAFPTVSVDWKARTEDHGGKTSPEELLAAAHSACFSMAFSSRLAKAGAVSISLDVQATATFVVGQGVTAMRLVVRGDAAGIDAEKFEELALDAKANCPISKALEGNVEVSLELS